MPAPEGYRKALRLMEMAERFKMPIITFIDTPGAYPGVGAEERGQSEAIARNLREMSRLSVPVICTVIGEGGSGGALAIGVGDKVNMLQYSTYSVISPEGCASILWKSADKAPLAAEAMGIIAPRLKELKLIDSIVLEPLGGAHRNPEAMAASLKAQLLADLADLDRAQRRRAAEPPLSASDELRLRLTFSSGLNTKGRIFRPFFYVRCARGIAMMLDLGEYQEESVNIIAIMGPHGVYHKDEPIKELEAALQRQGFQTIWPQNSADLLQFIEHNPRICGVIFDWDEYSVDLCSDINQLNEYLPLYAFINAHSTMDVSSQDLRMTLWFFEYALGLSEEIATRIGQYTREYLENITPPFTRALFNYVQEGKYTFCTPGHMGGSAYQKSPVGCLFYDFFGGNTLKADVSISVTELGSLLDHTGPHLEAEEYIARAFGAEQSYMVTNGTSTSNKIVGMYSAPAGSTLLIDRNCHKSLAHLLMMSDVVPLWLKPTRNALGILGGIPRREFTRDSIQQKVRDTGGAQWPVHAVITNSTYDGLLYNTTWLKETLDVPSIHFDSAWVPYTHFHPIYQGKSGMSGERIPGKVIFETQSTHKMLAALSQASLIHIKGNYDEETFNEAFMMHTSTSPSYPIVASIETAAAMLRGNSGKRLIQRSIERALDFRKEVQRLREESDGWFFDIWQPEAVDKAECWPVAPGEDWHGFKDADADHMYLDPVKVTILTPGMDEQGNMDEEGIPAALVAKFLDERGVVVEKTGPYNLLFLFSIGIDKTRAMGLLRGLTEFKRAYDLNLRVKNMLPDLYAEDPDFYRNMRIQDLAQGIHRLIRQHQLPQLMLSAFDVLPEMKMTPHHAWQRQIKGEVETIELENLVGRISANMILPYPPGVPLLMPGEMITEESRAVLDFLLMLCSIGRHYPGFETDIHGAKRDEDGVYRVRVLKNDERLAR